MQRKEKFDEIKNDQNPLTKKRSRYKIRIKKMSEDQTESKSSILSKIQD